MRLLVVGRLSGQLASAVKMAMAHGAKVHHVERGDQATEQLRRGQGADLLMVDYRVDIAALIAANEAERIHVPVVACGVDAGPDDAAATIRAGAKEFIPLPPEADMIAAVLSAVADDDRPLISADPSMKAVIGLADQVARSEASILITGESGVGKEVMARYLHQNSRRADKPFISVNCAAIPDNLLESELFGHEKGAFTGAVARRVGKFEEADGGTLLLDEIGELPLPIQAKLLRVLQGGQIERLGTDRQHRVDVRVLAATNRNLAAEVRAGRFRADLYHRLSVYPLQVPPLRERGRDVLLLAGGFLEENRVRLGLRGLRLAADAQAALLQQQPWPGNVRELEHLISRAAVRALAQQTGQARIVTLHPQHLDLGPVAVAVHQADPAQMPPPGHLPLRDAVDAFQRRLIEDALTRNAGNRAAAARELGLDRGNLHRLLRRLDMVPA